MWLQCCCKEVLRVVRVSVVGGVVAEVLDVAHTMADAAMAVSMDVVEELLQRWLRCSSCRCCRGVGCCSYQCCWVVAHVADHMVDVVMAVSMGVVHVNVVEVLEVFVSMLLGCCACCRPHG